MDKNKKITVSIILIAFACGLNITGISPILGVLSEEYAKYGGETIRLLQTLPYLLVMAGSLVVGYLTTLFTKKKIATMGLLIIGICGILPFFTDCFAVLFATRIVIGFGFGIVGPINTAVIAEFFQPEERVNYMGLHVVGMGLGTMAGNLLGGVFAGAGYRFFYLVYVMAFISTLGVRAFLMEMPTAAVCEKKEMKLNGRVYVIGAASFLHTLFINVYSTNISIYIYETVTRDSAVSGISTGINAAAALLMGVLFGKLSGRIGRPTLPLSIFVAGAGYGTILLLPGMAGVCLASICCGVSLSCFMAMSSYLISISVEPEAVAKASGVFSVMGGIGGLIAPVFLGKATALIFGADTSVNQFKTGFAGMLLFGICASYVIWQDAGSNGQA